MNVKPELVAIVLLLAGAVIVTDLIGALKGGGLLPAILAGVAASSSYATIFILNPRMGAYTSAAFRAFFISLLGALGSGVMLLAAPAWRPNLEASLWPIVGIAVFNLDQQK